MASDILSPMTPFPKPRGFWDYTLFALAMTGVLVFLFWLEASDGVGWADAALASATAVLFVLATILARRGEKARWIAQPTWHVYPVATLGAFVLMFGAIYADTYLLHRRDITFNRLRHDMVIAIVVIAGTVWSFLRRHRSKRQLS
jgi:hypothetical protein